MDERVKTDISCKMANAGNFSFCGGVIMEDTTVSNDDLPSDQKREIPEEDVID